MTDEEYSEIMREYFLEPKRRLQKVLAVAYSLEA